MNPASIASTVTKKSPTKTKFRIGVLTPITKQNNSDFMKEVFEAMCSLGFSVSVLAEGDSDGQSLCFNNAEKYPRQFSILESVGDSRNQILSKSDVVFFPVAPSKLEIKEVIAAGVVPILPEGCGLDNFDSKTEEGSAFTFQPGNIWSLVAAVVRASENRKFSWDWKTIKQNLAEVHI